MDTMKGIEIFEDHEGLVRTAAERIAATLMGALKEKSSAALVLTGGNTPRPVYELLAEPPYSERIPWDRVDFFWGDERCVPPDHPDSNFGMAWKAFLSRLPVPENRIHRMLGELEDHERAAVVYEEEIRRVTGAGDTPRFDLVLLGMGEDGHTASLFPGTVWDENRWVVANYVPKLQSTRITMTPRILNEARAIIFMASGFGKAQALKGVLEDPASDYPARRIRPVSGTLTWMVDKAAASLISNDE